ncbi:glutathione synthase [Pluteus cervinus]|uniref:Glutathione synthase n=1 Tax=Pluteus cervinus TaxID=181527 RepID=A0ACD3BAK2_9AGAR|nr:glutathione synthase [Pluteus cervinus]
MKMTSTSFDFASWPPELSETQLEETTRYATTYALAHGLLYLPQLPIQPPIPSSAIHAPLSLFPTPIPRRLFSLAQQLQNFYNILYARIALDVEFLDKVMGAEEGVGRVDEFTGKLWRGWKEIRDEGVQRPLQLGLFRSDYLLHARENEPLELKQVEFNTISSSFGTLSEQTAKLHRYLHATTGYYDLSPVLKEENFPPNQTTAGLAEGLAAAHKAYGNKSAYILFVVQAGERNVFDQRWLEYALLERHSIHVVRQTFDELMTSASLDSNRVLKLTLPTKSAPIEISTIYFRAGYTPTDYPGTEHYSIRFLLERSKAINCPSIPLQLAGGKKVQEVLTQPGVLETFTKDWNYPGTTSQEFIDILRLSWMPMWGLDQTGERKILSGSEQHLGVQKARDRFSTLVLKPQREGGGNNVYKEAIPEFLDNLLPEERQAWIAMELISPPQGIQGYLIRSGSSSASGDTQHAPVKTEVISELGIFGWALFGFEDGHVDEKEVGWLVRTKGRESNEGGVATGFSVLDSIVLVDE